MMTFRVHLKKTKKSTQSKLRFDHENLRNPDVAGTFQATIGGYSVPLINLRDGDIDIDSMITSYNTAVTGTASEILGKEGYRKKPLVTRARGYKTFFMLNSVEHESFLAHIC